jgi:hypothetical protein
MDEGLQTAFDFAAILALWSSLAPLVVSLLKNMGGNWPSWAKKLTAVIMAVLGSVVAYALALDISSIDWGSVSFWTPMIVGVVGAFSAQYAIYAAMWKGTTAEVYVANVTPLNADPVVYEKAA